MSMNKQFTCEAKRVFIQRVRPQVRTQIPQANAGASLTTSAYPALVQLQASSSVPPTAIPTSADPSQPSEPQSLSVPVQQPSSSSVQYQRTYAPPPLPEVRSSPSTPAEGRPAEESTVANPQDDGLEDIGYINGDVLSACRSLSDILEESKDWDTTQRPSAKDLIVKNKEEYVWLYAQRQFVQKTHSHHTQKVLKQLNKLVKN